jgi:bacterioferritin (cytochrome b1)
VQGDPEVLARMNAAYPILKALEEQAHLNEHLLESTGWCRLSDLFDAMESKLHRKVIHPFMNRVNDLGGVLQPGYAFPPTCWPAEQIGAAFGSMVQHLQEVRAAFIAICNAAEAADDYVTERLIWRKQAWIEGKIDCFEGHIARIGAIGLTAYLAEVMDKP